jgi:predicted phage gp36 major capsid-like protein
VALDVDLDREQDIEELRRMALALEAQNRLLLEALEVQRREIERLRGKGGDVQLVLKMLEALKAKADAAAAGAAAANEELKKRTANPRERSLRERSQTGPPSSLPAGGRAGLHPQRSRPRVPELRR